jgi:1-acyl-sn-glycerol-3-phosphate acyltransferase
LIFDQAVFRRKDSITTSSRPEYAMFVFRLLRLIAHLFKGMAVCAFLFPFTFEQGRQAHIRRWSRKLLRICGIAIKIDSPLPIPRSLLVSNHVSWLDIFVVNSCSPAVSWPSPKSAAGR